MPYSQRAYSVRFEWGVQGALAVGAGAAAVVVVDVLSFTTTLSVCADLRVQVYPYRFRDGSAAAFAAGRGAVLAVDRGEHDGVSLSPMSVRTAVAEGRLAGKRLVLPSPNGSTVSVTAASLGGAVAGGCLRNFAAVASWAAAAGGPVAVVAAGERWRPDGLRPAVEDLWGAGAVIAALEDLGVGAQSPEAAAAAAAWRSVGTSMLSALADCASGRELIADGYGNELPVAAEVGESALVPVLTSGYFTAS